ncbi:MAG: transketolase, partial [Microgenomates group bacterium]
MQSSQEIQELCKLVRHHILTSTTHAGSGHPTSSLSAVELITTLFFSGPYHYNIDEPHILNNDRFILSKGHASPLLYALYRVAGALTDDDLMKLRDHNSRLEGHPTPL